MTDVKRILIADDHPIFRQGLRQLFVSQPGLEVIAEAGDGKTALREIETLRPEVAILDLDMPEMDGFAVARVVKEKHLAVELVFLTMYKDEEMFNEALDL